MRLIDADALLETLESVYWARENESKYTGNRAITVTWNDAIATIKSAPTIEPERKKGKFVGTRYEGWVCSVCNVLFEDDPSYYNYCPNCGADMRGEE